MSIFRNSLFGRALATIGYVIIEVSELQDTSLKFNPIYNPGLGRLTVMSVRLSSQGTPDKETGTPTCYRNI